MSQPDDRDLFRSTARWYARYRPAYPAAFIEQIVTRFGLDGTGRLLDLGCGTGQLTLPLARYVEQAIGLDPQAEMLAEAERAAREAGIPNVRWLPGASTDLDRLRDDLRGVRAVVMGRSFHWMDSDATLISLSQIVAPGGNIVIVGDRCGVWEDDEDWQVATRTVIQRWLGNERRAGSGIAELQTVRWEDIIRGSPFAQAEDYTLTFERIWDIDHIVGFLYSTSFCSPAILGDRLPDFERDLRRELRALDNREHFTEQVRLGATFARLPE